MSDFIPSSPQQLEVYNAATAAGVPAAGIRLFIQGEKSNFKTAPDGAVLFNGVPISTALRLNPSIAAKYKSSSKTPMTLSEFTAEHLAGRIKPHEFGTIEITGPSREPRPANSSKVEYDSRGIGTISLGFGR